jgi:hypothetical protein
MGDDRMTVPYGLKALAAVAGVTLLLLLPAFWNGYPIFYFDSLDYISLPYTWKIPIFRTAGYGVFATIARPFNSIWTIVAIQSAILAYILLEARRILFPQLGARYAVVVLAILALVTGMPWLASTVMPDVFTVPAVLLSLMLSQTEIRLGAGRTIVFILLLALACVAHPTHFALCIGLILCIFVFDKLALYNWPFVRMHVRYAVVGVVLGIAATVASNWAATGRVFLTPRTTAVLTLAVLIEKGFVQEFLEETCNDPTARKSILCEQRARLPYDANEFLWHNPDFHNVGGWEAMINEAPWILDEIIDRHPIEFMRIMAELTLEQIVTFKTGEGFRTMVGFLDLEMRTYYARENAGFVAARQQSYKEVEDSPMEAINRLHAPFMLASLPLILVVIVLAWRQRDRQKLTLGGLVTLAYLGNSFICGAISNPADRYNNRIVWLVVLSVLVLLPPLIKAERERRSTIQPI